MRIAKIAGLTPIYLTPIYLTPIYLDDPDLSGTIFAGDILAQMNHQIFNDLVKNALKVRGDGGPEEAAAELRVLLHDLVPAVRSGVNDWHHQQALALLVDTLDMTGKDEECRAAWEELIELTEHAAVYWEKALSSARADFARWSLEHPPQR